MRAVYIISDCHSVEEEASLPIYCYNPDNLSRYEGKLASTSVLVYFKACPLHSAAEFRLWINMEMDTEDIIELIVPTWEVFRFCHFSHGWGSRKSSERKCTDVQLSYANFWMFYTYRHRQFQELGEAHILGLPSYAHASNPRAARTLEISMASNLGWFQPGTTLRQYNEYESC